MPSLITPPAPPPGSPNVTAEISTQGGHSVGAGETRYATGLYTMFAPSDFDPSATSYVLANAGTIWNENTAESRVMYLMNWGSILNSGTIVAHSTNNNADTLFVTSSFWYGITNSGSVYALADAGNATAIGTWNDAPIQNSGTIAALGLISATGIMAANGSVILNAATGSILAEARDAVAIYLGRGSDLTNHGLIEARSTSLGVASVAVYVSHLAGESMVIENDGVIRGDFAIYADSYSFSPPQHAAEWINNRSGGLIEGAIFTDLGDDRIVNEGQINGYVDMGDGADLFDNRLGGHDGNADMGWGNDEYRGGDGVDVVTGNRGNDLLVGGASDDLLIAGFGDDVLHGDAGSDGLYGEGGDDRIVTSGGDRVHGGVGDDRVELGDYRFAEVDGGSGRDVLVLPVDGRILDLSQVVASGRVIGFEEIELAANGRIAVQATDIQALTGGAALTIGGASGMVDLAGSWVQAGQQTSNGIAYTVYSSGGVQVLVAPGLTVNVASTPPGAVGLDPIDGGGTAPVPGTVPGADLSSDVTVSNGQWLQSDLEIFEEETWVSTLGNVLFANHDVSLVNRGEIQVSGGDWSTAAITGNWDVLENYGTITSTNFTGTAYLADNMTMFQTYGLTNMVSNGRENAYGVSSGGGIWHFANAGNINVSTDQSMAVGYLNYLMPLAENSGTITANSSHFIAVGFHAHNGGTFVNSGTIDATGAWGAYGFASSTHVVTLENSGTIRAHATGAGRDGVAVDIDGALGVQDIRNSGLIEGEIAVRSHGTTNGNSVWLDNSGQITGRIELGAGVGPAREDVVINRGTIDGTVSLGAGRDIYDGLLGVQTGAVRGEDGNDLLIGTSGRNTLDGGSGDDVLFGQGGDTLTGGSGRDTFVYRTAHTNAEVIADFVSGTDRIDLRSLAGFTSYSISGSTVTAQTAFGTLTIQVTGSVTHADILTTSATSFNGTTGNDVLVAGVVGANLSGGDGFDVLVGGAGNDRLDGGLGGTAGMGEISDVMYGGAGDDTYIVDANADWVVENADGGFDTIEFTTGPYSIFYEMPEFVERMIGGSGYGNSSANVMIGSAGADHLEARDGNDTVDGGAGNDTLSGGAGIDILTGGLGVDEFFGIAAELNGDTIADLSPGDRIRITDADFENFTWSLDGNVVTFTGGSLTLGNAPTLPFVVQRGWQGVELVLTQPDARNDFNGDGRSDVLWRHDNGTISNWLSTPAGGFVGNDANAWNAQSPTMTIVGTGDFTGNRHDDILWRAADGWLSIWRANSLGAWPQNPSDPYGGASIIPNTRIQVAQVSLDWKVAGIGDFNGDGRDDILWRSDAGQLSNWLSNVNNGFTVNDANAFVNVSTDWKVVGVGDFNGDGRDDILWRSDAGQLSNWLATSSGGWTANDSNAFVGVPNDWKVIGAGDFNGDGRDDILWRSESGALSNWLGTANGGWLANDANAFVNISLDWHIAQIGDFNGDGREDILWRSDAGGFSNWLATRSGGFVPNDSNAYAGVSIDWQVEGPGIFWL